MYNLRPCAAALLLLISVGACSKAKNLEREYEMLESSGGSLDERCAKLREIERAYLSEQKETKHLIASIKADEACQRAALLNM